MLIERYTKLYWKTIEQRFLSKIKKLENGCWEWTAGKNDAGYGLILIPNTKKSEYAHRLSYELFKEPISDNNVVMHTCDNPSCVNPDHLMQGTQLENMQDKMMKGRHRTGIHIGMKGEDNPSAKLDIETVKEIRNYHIENSISLSELAIKYNISKSQAQRIINGASWSSD